MKTLLQLLTLLPFASFFAPEAWSAPKTENHATAKAFAAVGKSEAADMAQRRHGGKVLKVDEVKKGGKTVYRVKLLLDGGRIKIVTIDANNGSAV